MALKYVGIDPGTTGEQCPTVWWDDETQEVIVQGWLAGPELLAQARETGPIPPTEAVVRLPARMIPIIREACDAAERANA